MSLSPQPKVRYELDFQIVEAQQEKMILVQDPWELQAEPLLLSQGAFMILQMLDGYHSVDDIQRELIRIGKGKYIARERIQEMFDIFDNAYLLEGRRFQRAYDAMLSDFTHQPSRKAVHAGDSYPEQRQELRAWLDEILETAPAKTSVGEKIVAVVAPHLDLRIEQKAYATSYQALKGADYERLLILGTGHQIQHGLFSLCLKDFETPLGTSPCDREAVLALEKSSPSILAPPLPHIREHSIEFQLPFLQHVLARPDIPIVPILCGSMYPFLDKVQRPSEIEGVTPFLEALEKLLTPETLLVLGVDFSHVGLKFGHLSSAEAMMEDSEQHDRNLLEALCAADLEAFWQEGKRVMDRYNVCGFSALSCLLELLPETTGILQRYDVWHEEETQSAVSFASLHFTESP